MASRVVITWIPPLWTDRQTRMKTLPSLNFVGGMAVPLANVNSAMNSVKSFEFGLLIDLLMKAGTDVNF